MTDFSIIALLGDVNGEDVLPAVMTALEFIISPSLEETLTFC